MKLQGNCVAPREKERYYFPQTNRTGVTLPRKVLTENFPMAKKTIRIALLIICAGLLLVLSPASPALALKKKLLLRGGPFGGTFQQVAEAIEEYPGIKSLPDLDVVTQSSAGSLENLREVHAGQADFGLVYSGHAYLGRKGVLQDDSNTYDQALAVASLYGAPAQLVVRKGSGIKSVRISREKGWGLAAPAPEPLPIASFFSDIWACGMPSSR